MKNSGSFHTSAQNIDCGYLLEPPRLEPPQRGGSNEYPQSIFEQKKEKNVYPCTSQFPSSLNGYAHAQSDQSLLCPHEETLHPWQSEKCLGKIQIRLCESAGWSESTLEALVRR